MIRVHHLENSRSYRRAMERGGAFSLVGGD